MRAAGAARAAPYEKGTETGSGAFWGQAVGAPRARPPMRRGLKHYYTNYSHVEVAGAARAAPYEKGTETSGNWISGLAGILRRARGPL